MSELDKILRPSLKGIQPYNSGLSISDIMTKYAVTTIAKLGSNENPYGPAPSVLEGLKQATKDTHLYPQSNAHLLRGVLASYINAPQEKLIFGNGSEELLSIICRSVIEENDRVITLYPSFPLHEDYVTMMGGKIETIVVDNDLKIDVEALIEAVKKPAKMLIFANPMNPVGAWLNPSELRDVIAAMHKNTLLVLDEAYFEYAIEGDYCSGLNFLKHDQNNWIILRTFSKAWGLAGLRIGYGVCSSTALRSALDLTRTPFNVNFVAQNAAIAALLSDEHMKKYVSIINQEREKIALAISNMGYKIAPHLGNFIFFDCGQPSSNIAEKLLSLGTIVKPWRQKGFDTFIRVSIGTPEENGKFLSDLKQI